MALLNVLNFTLQRRVTKKRPVALSSSSVQWGGGGGGGATQNPDGGYRISGVLLSSLLLPLPSPPQSQNDKGAAYLQAPPRCWLQWLAVLRGSL